MNGRIWARYRRSDGSAVTMWSVITADGYRDNDHRAKVLADMPQLVSGFGDLVGDGEIVGTMFVRPDQILSYPLLESLPDDEYDRPPSTSPN